MSPLLLFFQRIYTLDLHPFTDLFMFSDHSKIDTKGNIIGPARKF